MIGFLRGIPRNATEERVILDVGGVGYEVQIPRTTWERLRKAPAGEEVGLHIHTHVRDDALALYGFASEREKSLFEKLIGVGGIGPRLAQVILSGMAVGDLLAALAGGDLSRLVEIPGVGKRTAERMVLELREKVADLVMAGEEAPAAAPDADLVQALVNLGYKPGAAERAVAGAHRDHPEGDFQQLLRASLQRLSRA